MKIIIDDIPKSLNRFAGRQNVYEYREEKRRWKDLVFWSCKKVGVPSSPLAKAVVTIEYFFKTRMRRDADNYNGKMILDGLVAAGVIKDDSFGCIELRIKGNFDKNFPRTEIFVEEV